MAQAHDRAGEEGRTENDRKVNGRRDITITKTDFCHYERRNNNTVLTIVKIY